MQFCLTWLWTCNSTKKKTITCKINIAQHKMSMHCRIFYLIDHLTWLGLWIFCIFWINIIVFLLKRNVHTGHIWSRDRTRRGIFLYAKDFDGNIMRPACFFTFLHASKLGFPSRNEKDQWLSSFMDIAKYAHMLGINRCQHVWHLINLMMAPSLIIVKSFALFELI